ncbi:MAG: PadR family transcriptional regulator [Desulfurococcales archaeon]|nr:PadR family transcriptional regulator [Desulfurococcales archaeon]
MAAEETLRKPQELYRESLKTIILRILAEKPRHGYEIIKRIEEVTRGRWRPAAGTLYPLLEQMVREGLIEVERVESEGVKGGKRVIYALTGKGWKTLIELLEKKIPAKIDMMIYYFAETCILLRLKGYREEAEKLCSQLRNGIEKLSMAVERNCELDVLKW